MTNRLTKLNAKLIPLGDGNDPPSEAIVDYDRFPKDVPRKQCIECGKMHGYALFDYVEYTVEVLDKCSDCFWKNAFHYKPIIEQVNLNEC